MARNGSLYLISFTTDLPGSQNPLCDGAGKPDRRLDTPVPFVWGESLVVKEKTGFISKDTEFQPLSNLPRVESAHVMIACIAHARIQHAGLLL